MQTFTDKNNDKWDIELNVGTARKVLSECKIDLINVLDFDEQKQEKSVLEKLADDPILLVDVLYCLCSTQARERNLDDFAFASLFSAETIVQATECLMEEIINFSPPVTKKILMKIYTKNKQVMGENEKELEAILESPEFDKDLEAFMKSSTDMQESSE
jgi:hypothetical protein